MAGISKTYYALYINQQNIVKTLFKDVALYKYLTTDLRCMGLNTEF
jgi:hypothetical protein